MIGDILWPLAFILAVFRFSQAIEAFAPKSDQRSEGLAPEDVPDDLIAVAMQENEAWAQEEVLRVIRERYESLKDWNKVRVAMGIGRID